MKTLTRYVVSLTVPGAICLIVAPAAFALGFRNADQDAAATGQGEAFVAQADTPGAIYYNPGGLTQIKGTGQREE